MNICDYVISIIMRKLQNLMIIEQDVKKYELCALYVESIGVMISLCCGMESEVQRLELCRVHFEYVCLMAKF